MRSPFKALFWLLGLIVAATALAILARYNTAYAILVFPSLEHRVLISMNLFIVLFIALFALVYVGTRLVERTLALPTAVAAWRKKRMEERAARALQDAERLLLEGRYGQAFRHAELAWDGQASPGIAALIAAKAAHHLREPARRQLWLTRAAEHDREGKDARLMVEAERAVADRRFNDASALLTQLRAGGQRHIAALRLSLQTEQARGHWAEVARLARQLRKVNALSADQVTPLLRRAHIEKLRDAESDRDALDAVWQTIPEAERLDNGLLLRAVPYLIGAGADKLAIEAIEKALEKEWEPELALLYSRCKGPELRAQLATAERWLKAHPDDDKLLLSLGHLCLRAELWGKAQSYLEASLSLAPSRAAHIALARLAESLDRITEAHAHYRAAAELGA